MTISRRIPEWAANTSADPRVTIWLAAYYLWYDANYNTEVASRMVDRLKAVDDLTKVLVALTASGSLVAGWKLWSQPGLDTGWATLAGTGAVLSIIHGSLGIPARLKDWLEMKRDFLALRASLDGFRSGMQNHADFDVVEYEKQLNAYRIRYSEYEGRIPSDFFATRRLKLKCQDSLDARLIGRSSEPT